MWYNSNKCGEDRLGKELTSNRENIEKEVTHDIEPLAQKETLPENFSSTQVKQAFKDDPKPSNTSCSSSADEIGIGIDESRAVRFRNNLFVVSMYLVTLLNNRPSYILEITDSSTVGLDFHSRERC